MFLGAFDLFLVIWYKTNDTWLFVICIGRVCLGGKCDLFSIPLGVFIIINSRLISHLLYRIKFLGTCLINLIVINLILVEADLYCCFLPSGDREKIKYHGNIEKTAKLFQHDF